MSSKRKRSGEPGPYTAYRCQGGTRVHVLMADAVPDGSVLDLVRRTDMAASRDDADDGGAYVLAGIADDVAGPIFGLLSDSRRLVLPDLDEPGFGDRIRAAADYLQMPGRLTAQLAGITTSSIPHDVTFRFPHCVDRYAGPDAGLFSDRSGLPMRAALKCSIRRIRHPDATNLVIVTFEGGSRAEDCVYRIEHAGQVPDDDFESGIIKALAKSDGRGPAMHDTTVYLMHACANQAKYCHTSRLRAPTGLNPALYDALTCIELAYDHFGRNYPSIRLYGRPRVYGVQVPLPAWKRPSDSAPPTPDKE